MAYVKNTWATGDVVTATKLNNIEDGIEEAAQSGGSGLCVTTSEQGSSLVLSATFQEIEDAIFGGSFVFVLEGDSFGVGEYEYYICPLARIISAPNVYMVVFSMPSGLEEFTALAKSGYPSQSNDVQS